MTSEGLRPVGDTSAGDWIAPRLQRDGIAGVRHHVRTEGRRPRRYEMTHETSEWTGSEPATGNLDPETQSTVLDVLARFTGDANCFHAMWAGWGWLHPGGWTLLSATDGDTLLPGSPAPAGPPPGGVGGTELQLARGLAGPAGRRPDGCRRRRQSPSRPAGAPGATRTHTARVLNPLPLPIGVRGRAGRPAATREA